MKCTDQNISSVTVIWKSCLTFLAFTVLSIASSYSQYPVNYQYTLLPSKIIDELVGASSGDLAMQHIYGMAPYDRSRDVTEYSDVPREVKYITGKMAEYGIKNYRVEKFAKVNAWKGIEGTLWEVSPGLSKIADYNDLPDMLAEGSQKADVKAQLIWAGEGQASFFENNAANIKGKIVVTSGNVSAVHSRAMRAGALGTISFYSSRALIDPVQIPNSGIYGGGFAFMLPPREGELLRDRLLRREQIEVRAKVDAVSQQIDMQVPQCVIEGTDTTAGEVLFTAHLFEGYVKMGANDNTSGAAVLIEVVHLLNDLITGGIIPKPARSIRFLWVPEFSGTIPWVNRHPGIIRRTMCDINLDMVGLRLRDSRSFMYFHRAGYSTAHFVNDVMESYYRYVGETNSEGITDEMGRRGFTRRIVSPTGTSDPFYYKISTLHGSSDNAVFNDWTVGLPGVKMIDWPDNYYHTSEDNPDKCDPTQLRRVIFIAAAGAYTMASADDAMALRILSEMYAGACTRVGIQMAKSTDIIFRSNAESLKSSYRRAAFNVEGTILAEKEAMDKLKQLSVKPEVITMINSRKEKLDGLLQIQLSVLRELMVSKAKELSVPVTDLKPNELEAAAIKIIPEPTPLALTLPYSGDSKFVSSVAPDFIKAHPYRAIVNTDEAAGMANGRLNILQIKKMVDAQFERESPLQDIMNYYAILKEAGLMKF
jgi:aminopeptidase YwaD